ncbi:LacI family DNA-binding transcriptional regulator [Bacillus horti]|uniref:LacI family kdg operon repressor n=1 Tax=Caldalkalibacillus horti TaxID=77523 RepID=A0ABT9W2Q9_9BACI|nr:substrate-binding domain-containing protein [Bacillus horti]MDQ0167521.1 LacI family kdg operon repressor [Bacillus horti]
MKSLEVKEGLSIKKPTIADVAHEAGVSKSTVSQYMNKRYEYMSSKTKGKIELAIKELGYTPNYIAKSLKQKRTLTIGIIVANILHHFSTQVSRAIEDLCQERGYQAIICNADDQPDKERSYIDMLRAKQVDGIIAIPTEGNTELYAELVQQGYPVVFLDRTIADIDIPAVVLNNFEAARGAVAHLLQQGHRSIGMLTGPLNISVRRERVDGYLYAMEQHEVEHDYIWMKEVTKANAMAVLENMFTLKQRPTALVIGNDFLLLETLKFVKSKGIKVPDELAFITFDEVEYADLFQPTISTISQPAFQMGRKAAELLLGHISEKKRPAQLKYEFTATMKLRDSCGENRSL